MKLLELFSGIGGFARGFEQAGYEFSEHYFSEIDKHAIANYKYNFPNAKYIGSVTDIRSGSFRKIDLITFGSPCQDFSLAGKRQGLEGERSSLIKEAIRLITDIRPNIFIWENVKGAFSSNDGADFWAILQAFAHIGGYRLECNCLIHAGFSPKIESGYTLSDILQEEVDQEYFLSEKKLSWITSGQQTSRLHRVYKEQADTLPMENTKE